MRGRRCEGIGAERWQWIGRDGSNQGKGPGMSGMSGAGVNVSGEG